LRGHLAKQLAGAAQCEHDLAAIGSVGDQLDPSRQHQHDLIAGGAGTQDWLVALHLPSSYTLHEGLGIVRAELAEERDVS